jgi:putative FmdB family regulatory protein
MPHYEFVCQECNNIFEIFRDMKDSNKETFCPKCNSICDKNISGGLGFILKGEGFYCNDYKKQKEYKEKE